MEPMHNARYDLSNLITLLQIDVALFLRSSNFTCLIILYYVTTWCVNDYDCQHFHLYLAVSETSVVILFQCFKIQDLTLFWLNKFCCEPKKQFEIMYPLYFHYHIISVHRKGLGIIEFIRANTWPLFQPIQKCYFFLSLQSTISSQVVVGGKPHKKQLLLLNIFYQLRDYSIK